MEKLPSVDTLAFLAGCIFLAAGITGGGFTIFHLRVPKLPLAPRILVTLVGSFLILAGLGAGSFLSGRLSASTKRCDNLPPNTVPDNLPVVEITDRLGDQQDFERVDISVSDVFVGSLCVEAGRERASIRVPLSGKMEEWKASGSEQRKLRDKSVRTRSVTGRGQIDLVRPGTYSVRIVADGSTDTVQSVWLRRN